MRWRPTSGSGPCSQTSSVSLLDLDFKSSSERSWCRTQPWASAIARRGQSRLTREPGTCRRSRASSSDARPRYRAISDLLASHRLVEIVGAGGIGKTAVAIAIGRRMADPEAGAPGGVWLARLESATTADEVLDTVIAALHVTGGEAALLERLKAAPAMVLLDNCEHVLDSAAELATHLLDAAPTLRILCTSQIPLDVEGETVFELTPLALPEAVELFTRRAAARHRDQLAEGGDAVQDLCRSLDGLPLAIELAAARTKTLSIEEISRRLDDRFSVLSDPTSRRPERRRALKATIQWSYELLFPDDQRGLWALATFAGGAPLPAVEFVLAALDVPASAAIDVVGRLASRSLVIVEGDQTAVRYRLLDSIRAFALDALTESGLSDRALAAHAAWFADAAAASTDGVRSSRQAEHLSFARVERPNIDAALTWSATHDPLLALSIVNGFGWAWIVLGDSRGAQRILTALDAAGADAPARDRAGALLLAAWIEASADRLEHAREHIAEAARLAEAIDDVDLQARCSYYLAYVLSHQGEWGEAMELTDRASTLYGGLDRPWDQAANWLFAARAAISAGDRVRAVEACDQVERWLRSVDDPWLHVRRDAILGELARIEHRFDDAVLHLGRAAETSGRLGFRQTEAYQLSSLGRAQCQAGDYATGASTLALAIEKAEATGDVRLAALARVHLGRVLRALGQVAAGTGGTRIGDRLAPSHRGRRAGSAQRVPTRGARRRGWSLRCGAEARHHPRRGSAQRRRPRRGLRPRRSRAYRRDGGRPRQSIDLERGRRPAHGIRLALHHRARSDRRPRGQADRVSERTRLTPARPGLAPRRPPPAVPASDLRDHRAGGARRKPATRP